MSDSRYWHSVFRLSYVRHFSTEDNIFGQFRQKSSRDQIEPADDIVELVVGAAVHAIVQDDLDQAAVGERLDVVEDAGQRHRTVAQVRGLD